MKLGRAVSAHLFSVLIGSLLITIGIETIALGMIGPLSGAGKWIGGFLIFAILALVSLPLGSMLRWCTGKLPLDPLGGAVATGGCVGFVLIFVLHPAMYPSVSFSSHPLALSFVHILTGLLCGWLWHAVEFRSPKALVDD